MNHNCGLRNVVLSVQLYKGSTMQCNIKSNLILYTFICMYFICILNVLCFDILLDFLPSVTIIFVSIHSCKVVFFTNCIDTME